MTAIDYDNPDENDFETETSADWPDLMSEHCQLNGRLNANLSWFDSSGGYQASQNVTFNRHAQTTYELQTGGKGKAGQQSLFILSAGAQSGALLLQPDWNEAYPWSYVPDVPVDPTQIQMMSQNEDAAGNVYGLLADNQTVDVTPQAKGKDYYTWGGPGYGKYTPVITANGVTLDPDNAVAGADFCVGQYINFAVAGIPGPYDNVTIWTLPGTFVNTNSDPNCDLFYEENAAFLRPPEGTTSTHCWYVKDAQQVVVSVDLYYRCTEDGKLFKQTITGKFNVHRPTTAEATPYQPDGTPTAEILGNSLSLGVSGVANDMSFSHTITTDGFCAGQAGYVQVITSADVVNSDPPIASPNGIALDTKLGLGDFPRGTPPVPANATTSVRFFDAPSAGLPSSDIPVSEDVSFSTYLMFQPTGGIWVPLRLITWELHDHADPAWTAYNSNNGNTTRITGDDITSDFPHWTTTW